MSIERDRGYEALQRGEFSTAVPLLETACRNDPNDFYAHLYLGAAYGQTERAAEATEILTRAVQIEPANAQARYNLGIALERGGWPEQAMTVFQQAITLQPDYPQAIQALQRLQGATSPAPAAPQPTQMYQSAAAAPQSLVEPGLGSYAPTPTQAAYVPPGATPASSPYGAPAARPFQPMTPQTPYYEDRFDLAQAFKDWAQVLASPGRFFAEQVGREGLKAPMASLLAYSLILGIVSILAHIVRGDGAGAVGGLIGIPLAFLLMLLMSLVYALLLHGIGNMFGNTAAYSGSFRAHVYSIAPGMLLTCINSLIASPQASTGAAALSSGALAGLGLQMIIGIISLIWATIVSVMAISSIQRISSGAAFGVAFLAGLVVMGIGVALFVGLAGVFVALAGAHGGFVR